MKDSHKLIWRDEKFYFADSEKENYILGEDF